MALSDNIRDREFDKFQETLAGLTAVRTLNGDETSSVIDGTTTVKHMIDLWVFIAIENAFKFTYPSPTTDEISFTKKVGLVDVEVLRLRLTYASASKEQLTEVRRVA